MKKLIFSLIFVLSTMLNIGQNTFDTGYFKIGINNSPLMNVDMYQGSAVSDVDTFVVHDLGAIITFDFNGKIAGDGLNNQGTYAMKKSGIPVTSVATGSIVHTSTVVNTFTFTADDSICTKTYFLQRLPSTLLTKFVIKVDTTTGPPINSQTNDSIQFTWKAIQGVNHYEYQTCSTASFTLPVVNTTTNSCKIAKADLPIGLNYFRVRGKYTNDTTTQWSVTSVSVAAQNTGIHEMTNVSELKLYPNPTTKDLNLTFTTKTPIESVSVYSINGQLIMVEMIEPTIGENKVSLNVESLSPGVYFTKVGIKTFKFVKN